MNNVDNITEQANAFEDWYMNKMQIRATIIDPNVLIGKIARATGKTEGIMGPRTVRVSQDLPGQTSVFVNKTYVSLFSNIIPNLRAYYSKPYGAENRPLWEENVDYILGSSKLPKHFKKPLRPPTYPKHAMITSKGHVVQFGASEQPESVAGQSFVHAFIEEMKHNKGDKLKSRLFPSLRGALGAARQSAYFEGITGVSDAARVDLGEDNWFEEYENIMNKELIDEVWTAAKDVNDLMVKFEETQFAMMHETDQMVLRALQKKLNKYQKKLDIWKPRLAEMRQATTYFITASTFANKDFLGPKFFKTQLESMTTDEFLVAICNITQKRVENMFFNGYSHAIHGFEDSYKYHSIVDLDLKDTFTVTADLLKYYDPNLPLILGYDPGYFSSIIVCQYDQRKNEFRAIKEFYHWDKLPQGELAKQIWAFFGPYQKNRKVILCPDRAGNKKREVEKKITTDSLLMKAELEQAGGKTGFRVDLRNKKQKTIYYYQHYNLLEMLLSEQFRSMPRFRLDLNECKNLNSSIYLTPVKKDDGRIEMDKSTEKTVAWQYQAGLTPQLASALMYAIYTMLSDKLPKQMKKGVNSFESVSV